MDSPTVAASFHLILFLTPFCHAVINGFLCSEEQFNYFIKQVERCNVPALFMSHFACLHVCVCVPACMCVCARTQAGHLVCPVSKARPPVSRRFIFSSSRCTCRVSAWRWDKKRSCLTRSPPRERMVLWGEIVKLNGCGGITQRRLNTTCCVSGLWNLKVVRGKMEDCKVVVQIKPMRFVFVRLVNLLGSDERLGELCVINFSSQR